MTRGDRSGFGPPAAIQRPPAAMADFNIPLPCAGEVACLTDAHRGNAASGVHATPPASHRRTLRPPSAEGGADLMRRGALWPTPGWPDGPAASNPQQRAAVEQWAREQRARQHGA
jgi:hypothetical protein